MNVGHHAAKRPINSNDLHAVVRLRWGQDQPRTGFVYALCNDHGEPLPFVQDGGAQPWTQRFPQTSMPTVLYVGQVWCTDVSRIRIFKDVDGLNASEVAPEWYWNQATYLLMPSAP